MPLDTYENFKSAFLSWADNDDVALRADDMIALTHARLNRTVRLEEMTVMSTANTTGADPWIVKPVGYVGMRRFKINDIRYTGLDYITFGEFDDVPYLNQTGRPTNYTVLGDRFRLGPIPDANYELEVAYYQAQAPLSPTVDSNAFLVRIPDLLLYGCLVESEPWLRDNEMFALWETRWKTGLAEVLDDSESDRFPAGQLAMRCV